MPTINGQKMACEPCIRGHRSTKCNHANDRLMVPVRKPGRPLSACPHPANQQCACGSVTAAIPRKQQCGCGTGEPTEAQAVEHQHINAAAIDAPSPTKVTFRVQKPSSRPASRKQSFDPSNFARMDMNSVNIVPYDQQPQQQPVGVQASNGYSVAPLQFGFAPQFAQIQPQYGYVPMQPLPINTLTGPVHLDGHTGNMINGGFSYTSLEHVIESPLPLAVTLDQNGTSTKGGSCCAPKPQPEVAQVKARKGGSCCAPKAKTQEVKNSTTNGNSCCAPKLSHSHTSSTASSVSEPPEPQPGSCCSSKSSSTLKHESSSSRNSPQMPHQLSPQDGLAIFPQYMPQPTVFTYPPSYGSFQHPLQPSDWRQNTQGHSYAQPAPPPMPYETSIDRALDTIHECGCGDTCQCIGCAAHPYNEATKTYVRSAWDLMGLEGQSSNNGEIFTNGQANGTSNMETVTSPTAVHTPSSTTSNNGDEQSFPASDFLFVNYTFSSEACGGDTQTCPCGEDCEITSLITL
ncbi:Protein GRISEA [Phlyctema vagabunda]|uniref:Protein GRISEA n=1 Tax=Phlyctema vagabunda TaxID=108571 RepID=A0ABR4PBE3_9HELO